MAEPDKWPFPYCNATASIAGATDFQRLRRVLGVLFNKQAVQFVDTIYVYGGDSATVPCVWVLGHGESAGFVINSTLPFEGGIAVGYDSGDGRIVVGLSDNSAHSCSQLLVDKIALYSDQGTAEVVSLNLDGSVRMTMSGTSHRAIGVFFVQTEAVTVSNSSAATTLIGAGAGDATLGASYLTSGTAIRIRARGRISTALTPGTHQVRIKVGSVVVAQTPEFVPLPELDAWEWSLEADVVCRSAGASGVVLASGMLLMQTPEWSEETSVPIVVPIVSNGTTVDTTIVNDVDVVLECGSASVDNVTRCDSLTLERLM